ncbi:MAG TPA: ABC transporter substrate-binding protein [Candidatus Limnocylindria bacterium]|nr:ABC transporter substrate-binding protein [Candidatus Limnocylindria bacterium]
MVVGLVGEPRTVFDDDPSARFIASAVTETLVRRDAHDELTPRLAESVPTLENGGLRVVTDDVDAPDGRLVATFRLRDAKWQDGVPITATDVRFAWQQDHSATPGTMARWTADRISDVQVLGPRDLRVLYRNGERWDDYALGPHVMPSGRLSQATTEQRAAYAREPVHAGAFAIAAWLPGSVTLSAYPGFVLGAPKLGRLEIHFFSTRAAALQALLRGDIDVAPWPVLEADLAKTLDRFADGTHLLAHYVPTEAGTVLRFGPDPRRFGDPLVRKAIELTIDRQSIVDDVFVGRARVPRSYLLPPQWAAAEDVPSARPDRDRARALLGEAGFSRGDFGIVERGGERMTATLDIASGSQARTDVARRVAGDLAAIGIAVDVRERALPDLLNDVGSGHFDLAITSEEGADPQLASERWAGLVDPWFDALALIATQAPDRAEKRAVYSEMERIWTIDLPALPLYQELRVDVAPQSLTGIQPTPSGSPLSWNAFEWSFSVR